MQLENKKDELTKYEAVLSKKEKVIKNKSFELEKLNKNLEKYTDKKQGTKKKLVQTTFFKPTVLKEEVIDDNLKELMDLLRELDINSLTPVEALKKLSDLKDKLNVI